MVNENNTVSLMPEKRYIKASLHIKLVALLAFLSAFVGHITIYDYLVATAWMGVALFLIDKEDFWILFVPLSIFENTIFFYFTNYTIFKILLLISVVKLLLEHRRVRITFHRFVPIFFVLAIYVVMNLREALPGAISIAICVLTMFMACFTCYKMQDAEFFRRAMFGFALFAIAAGVYGILQGNSRVVSADGDLMLRFCGTSTDPNTMGFKFVIGFAALWFTDLIKSKAVKVLGAIFLLYVILRTVSTTAIVALCIMAVLIVVLQKSSFIRFFAVTAAALVIILLFMNLESVLIFLAEKEPFGLNLDRLLSQYYSFASGDFSQATSLRTEIWDGYMEYFFHKQGVVAQFFGGNVSNIYGIEKNFAQMSWDAAAHNTNIDILMSVGFVGLLLVYIPCIITFGKALGDFRKTRDRASAMRITVKVLTLFYTFSLSAFLSYGFMIFLL